MKNALCIAILATAASGCTHAQLNRSTLFQASTLADLQFQQVLDNVARFVANPYTMPYFAYPTSGSTQIADGGTVSPTISWAPHSTASEMLGLSANRTITEGWGLVPVTNPDKLYAMRCAYQRLVGAFSMPCDICDDRLGNYLPKDFRQRPECYVPAGWFCVGRKGDMSGKRVCYASHCCDRYVWVTPEGMDGFTKFTLTILNIATFAPPSSSTTQMKLMGAPQSEAPGAPQPRETPFVLPGPVFFPQPAH
jgi:hypothetical protein